MKSKGPNYSYEQKLWSMGKTPAGIDEVGRGPLAGPVVAAAVILPRDMQIEGLNDSKKLSEKKRETLFQTITESATAYAIGIVEPGIIDNINILQAALLAMKNAVTDLGDKPDHLLIDGNKGIECPLPQWTIVKGDSKCSSIAAASIVAKVTRDKIMEEYHTEYPVYNFKQNKGYPTKEHLETLRVHGPSSIHRLSFRGVL